MTVDIPSSLCASGKSNLDDACVFRSIPVHHFPVMPNYIKVHHLIHIVICVEVLIFYDLLP